MSVTPAWTDLIWVDLLGRPRTVRTLSGDLSGLTVPGSAVAAGHAGPADLPGELRLVPDLASARPSLDGDVQLVMADLYDEAGPSPLCSRGALRAVLQRLADEGYEVSAAAEFEFFLLDQSTGEPLYEQIEQYSIPKAAELEPVVGRLRRELTAIGIPVEASNPEYSGGQVEVNLRHGAALAAADQATLLRWLARRLAREAGLGATFMAKPWTSRAGSGMHVHQSLWQEGANVFHDSGSLSATCRSYVAGQLAWMRSLSLFGSATPNAYHRRVGYSFAPTAVCWGGDNRSLAVRAILGSEPGTRVEQRDAAADCNVYLTFAGQFAAGFDGMSRRLEPAAPVRGDAYAHPGPPPLPVTFLEAFSLLEGDAAARALVGSETTDAYLRALAAERDLVIASSADWERDRYLGHV